MLPSHKLWLPDVSLYNSLDSLFVISGKEAYALVDASGAVYWYPGGQYKTLCPMDVRKYPMDVQTCEVEIGQWYTHDLIQKLTPLHKGIFMTEVTSTNWRPLRTDVRVEVVDYYGYNYSRCSYSLVVCREPIFVLLNVLSPIVLLTFLNVLVFKLPASTGEKMTLCISVMISFSVFLTSISQMMPKVSNKVSFLEIYLSFQLALSGLSIAGTVLILRVHNRCDQDSVPSWIQHLLTCKDWQCFNRGCLRRRRPSHGETSEDVDQGIPEKQLMDWRDVAQALDGLFFSVCLTTAVVSTLILTMSLIF